MEEPNSGLPTLPADHPSSSFAEPEGGMQSNDFPNEGSALQALGTVLPEEEDNLINSPRPIAEEFRDSPEQENAFKGGPSPGEEEMEGVEPLSPAQPHSNGVTSLISDVNEIFNGIFGDDDSGSARKDSKKRKKKDKKKSKKSKKSKSKRKKGEDYEDSAPKRRKRGGKKKKDGDALPEDDVDRVQPSVPPKPMTELERAMAAAKKKKREKLSEEQVKEISADFVRRLDLAAERDRQANINHQPAVNKLSLLEEVRSMFAKMEQSSHLCLTLKVHLVDQIVTDGGLAELAQWLKPLPNGALPNLNLRTGLLEVLDKLPVSLVLQELRASGIGRSVNALARDESESPGNRKIAQGLVQRWSRPILGAEDNYKKLEKYHQEKYEQEEAPVSRRGESQAPYTGPRWRARVPSKTSTNYIVRPASSVNPREKSEAETLRNIERNLLKAKKRA